eukprot:jgi/Chlat1/7577/Chrsp63S07066
MRIGGVVVVVVGVVVTGQGVLGAGVRNISGLAAMASSAACTSSMVAVQAPTSSAALRPAGRTSFLAGQKVAASTVAMPVRRASLQVRAAETAEAASKEFTAPKLNPDTPSPIFGGSTGGLLRKAQVEEFYAITWEGKQEAIFEMPTGGAAIMRKGPNLLKLARKEQCLALGRTLREKSKINYQIYRIFPSGEVQYLHPKDGVYPEKVNAGRTPVNANMRSIGENTNPAKIKFTGKKPADV